MNARVVLAILLISTVGVRAEIVLRAGDSYAYHFHTLYWYDPWAGGPQTVGFEITFSEFEPGSVVRYELWESGISGEPAHSGVFTPDFVYYYQGAFTNLWNDKEGTIRFTTLTGSVTVPSFELSGFVATPGSDYVNAFVRRFFYPEFGPSLGIFSVSGGLQLRWPTNASPDFVLETTDQINSGSWSIVTNAPAVVGQHNVVTLTNMTTMRFFRLRK